MSDNKRFVVDWEAVRSCEATTVPNAERVVYVYDPEAVRSCEATTVPNAERVVYVYDPEAVRGREDWGTVDPKALIEYMRRHGYLTRP